jgi:hypothetical protein
MRLERNPALLIGLVRDLLIRLDAGPGSLPTVHDDMSALAAHRVIALLGHEVLSDAVRLLRVVLPPLVDWGVDEADEALRTQLVESFIEDVERRLAAVCREAEVSGATWLAKALEEFNPCDTNPLTRIVGLALVTVADNIRARVPSQSA